MDVRIFTDSACDLEFSELEALQVELLRIPVFFDEERYIEGENLTREEFYEKLAVSERLPKTAQITPVEFGRRRLCGTPGTPGRKSLNKSAVWRLGCGCTPLSTI